MGKEKVQEDNSALDTNKENCVEDVVVSGEMSAESIEPTSTESVDADVSSEESLPIDEQSAAIAVDNIEEAENFPVYPRSYPAVEDTSAVPVKSKSSKKKKSTKKEKPEPVAADETLTEFEDVNLSKEATVDFTAAVQTEAVEARAEAQEETISSELEISDDVPSPATVEESPLTSFLRESAEAEAALQKESGVTAELSAAEEHIEKDVNSGEIEVSDTAKNDKSAKKQKVNKNDGKVADYASLALDPIQKRLRKKYKLDNDELFVNNEVIDGFVLASTEKVLRSYQSLSTANGTGIITVTNKRVLFNVGERTEIPVENIVGIKYAKYSRFSFASFLFSLILIGGGVFVALFLERFIGGMSWYKSWLKYVSYGVGAVMALCSIPLLTRWVSKSFYLRFYSLQNEAFVSYKGAGKKKDLGESETSIIAGAGKECSKAAREIGALLLDIKAGRYND